MMSLESVKMDILWMCNNNVKLLNVYKLLNFGIIMIWKVIGIGFSRFLGNVKYEKRKE